MNKEAELIFKLQKEMNFDKLVIIGLNDETEQMTLITSSNLSEMDTMLVLTDAMADVTIGMWSQESDIIH